MYYFCVLYTVADGLWYRIKLGDKKPCELSLFTEISLKMLAHLRFQNEHDSWKYSPLLNVNNLSLTIDVIVHWACSWKFVGNILFTSGDLDDVLQW